MYTINFANISVGAAPEDISIHKKEEGMDAITTKSIGIKDVDKVKNFIKRLEQQREEKVYKKHWIVARGKDKKVLL